jgi:nucleotide-binding universal stress UspA family protein
MPASQTSSWASPHRILLATDLVDLGFTLPVAIQQAKDYKAEVRIAHILTDANVMLDEPPLGEHPESDRVREAAEKKLKEAVATAVHAGIQCSFHLVAGNVVVEITKLAEEWQADRLISGSHGTEKLHLHTLGSVAESIFHRIEVPVMVIGPKVQLTGRPPKERMRIVFATPLDHDSRRMAEFALSVAEKHGAEISLLYVGPKVAKEHPSAARVSEYARKMLQDLLSVRPLHKCRPVCEVVHGQPTEEILKYAKENSADMIILGTSAHSTFSSHFVPGTAYRVLCESSCPVLVLKQESIWVSTPKQDTRAFNVRHP